MTAPARTNPDANDAARTLTFEDDGTVPNNPDLPVVLLRGAVDPGAGEAAIRALYEANGWHETWTASVFDYQHYHPDAHEALCVAQGWADIQIGGPSGEILRVSAGDAMILPAGVGHCRCDKSDDFQICGGYPSDQPHATVIRAPDERRPDHVDQIAALSRPKTDPIFGEGGALVVLWG
ncbi:hypothetical protein ATO8_11946 [Roseivivax marinus]|uniref:Cupin type-1 domain-containing protein n=1 Tax=Roseivivax marinus TaxID=1379903 RepID=W4HJT2_9RHOB|nr:cupin domain-containing protein [Roseivivax marinus]ETW12260.1 hypothetical protein ATO8_11946 [Roseivivax marinus]UMA64430.1 cupin [Roseivivax marinus]